MDHDILGQRYDEICREIVAKLPKCDRCSFTATHQVADDSFACDVHAKHSVGVFELPYAAEVRQIAELDSQNDGLRTGYEFDETGLVVAYKGSATDVYALKLKRPFNIRSHGKMSPIRMNWGPGVESFAFRNGRLNAVGVSGEHFEWDIPEDWREDIG